MNTLQQRKEALINYTLQRKHQRSKDKRTVLEKKSTAILLSRVKVPTQRHGGAAGDLLIDLKALFKEDNFNTRIALCCCYVEHRLFGPSIVSGEGTTDQGGPLQHTRSTLWYINSTTPLDDGTHSTSVVVKTGYCATRESTASTVFVVNNRVVKRYFNIHKAVSRARSAALLFTKTGLDYDRFKYAREALLKRQGIGRRCKSCIKKIAWRTLRKGYVNYVAEAISPTATPTPEATAKKEATTTATATTAAERGDGGGASDEEESATIDAWNCFFRYL